MICARSIDFETGVVILECLKKRRTGVYRAVPLPSTLLETLRRWIEQDGIAPENRLWPWSRMTGYRRITEVMGKAQIVGPWATPKGLRHGFGVRAVQSGAPLHLVQRWLGHADMKTTAIYAGAVGPEEREIAAKTWLKQDGGQARPVQQQPVPAAHDPESSHASGPWQSPMGPLQPDAPVERRKPWFKRLFSRSETISTCQMLHFYLFRSKISDDIS